MPKRFVAIAICLMLASPAAGAPLSYFAWTPSGNGFLATQQGIDATVSYNTSGDDPLYRKDLTMTAPTFVASYGSPVPTLKMDNGAAGSAGLGNTEVVFSSPLPAGSRLFIFDVDVQQRGERMLITTRSTLSLIEQLETQAGATSVFPAWSQRSATLSAIATTPNNEEATVFDASGFVSLNIGFRRNAGGDGFNGASFAFAIPVPEPASSALLIFGLTLTARIGVVRQRAN